MNATIKELHLSMYLKRGIMKSSCSRNAGKTRTNDDDRWRSWFHLQAWIARIYKVKTQWARLLNRFIFQLTKVSEIHIQEEHLCIYKITNLLVIWIFFRVSFEIYEHDYSSRHKQTAEKIIMLHLHYKFVVYHIKASNSFYFNGQWRE